MREGSLKEAVARTNPDAHWCNCETLMGKGALYVAPEFAPHIRAVLTALPFDITEKLMELKVAFLAVEKSTHGLNLGLPSPLHAHPTSDSHPKFHTHPGGKILYFSPLLIDTSPEQIRFTIAHEIAHAVLSHTDDSPKDKDKRQERQADKLAERWGFKRPPTVPSADVRSDLS
jgi:hypothetical protein